VRRRFGAVLAISECTGRDGGDDFTEIRISNLTKLVGRLALPFLVSGWMGRGEEGWPQVPPNQSNMSHIQNHLAQKSFVMLRFILSTKKTSSLSFALAPRFTPRSFQFSLKNAHFSLPTPEMRNWQRRRNGLSAIGGIYSDASETCHIQRKCFSTSTKCRFASPLTDVANRPKSVELSKTEKLPGITDKSAVVDDKSTLINRSFYRRSLPPHLVSFESPEGKQIFKRCLTHHTAEPYFHLAGNFTLQSDPAYCGPSTLAMVLNALEVDPNRQWKGVWRWWSDEMLECAPPAEVIRRRGISFGDFAGLARCNGLDVEAKRGDKITYEEFMEDVKRVCSQNVDRPHFASEDWEDQGGNAAFMQQHPHEDESLVVNFSRKTLGQTGDGHFSALAAYDAETDSILVLDVARFKYPSYFVKSRLLFDSMIPVDKETGIPRGYLLLKRGRKGRKSGSVCSVLETKSNPLHKLLLEALPAEFSTVGKLIADPSRLTQNVDWVARTILHSWPEEYRFLLTASPTETPKTNQFLYEQKELLAECLENPLYPAVERVWSDTPDVVNISKEELQTRTAAMSTMLLLALPDSLYQSLSPSVKAFFEDARPTQKTPLLKQEVERLKDQISVLMNDFCGCGHGKGTSVQHGSVAWINLSRLSKF
jgi:glutathione gamma-glutamylcysteinyltransferase